MVCCSSYLKVWDAPDEGFNAEIDLDRILDKIVEEEKVIKDLDALEKLARFGKIRIYIKKTTNYSQDNIISHIYNITNNENVCLILPSKYLEFWNKTKFPLEGDETSGYYAKK